MLDCDMCGKEADLFQVRISIYNVMNDKVVLVCRDCVDVIVDCIFPEKAPQKAEDTTDDTMQSDKEDNPHKDPLFIGSDKCKGCTFRDLKQECPIEKHERNEVIRNRKGDSHAE